MSSRWFRLSQIVLCIYLLCSGITAHIIQEGVRFKLLTCNVLSQAAYDDALSGRYLRKGSLDIFKDDEPKGIPLEERTNYFKSFVKMVMASERVDVATFQEWPINTYLDVGLQRTWWGNALENEGYRLFYGSSPLYPQGRQRGYHGYHGSTICWRHALSWKRVTGMGSVLLKETAGSLHPSRNYRMSGMLLRNRSFRVGCFGLHMSYAVQKSHRKKLLEEAKTLIEESIKSWGAVDACFLCGDFNCELHDKDTDSDNFEPLISDGWDCVDFKSAKTSRSPLWGTLSSIDHIWYKSCKKELVITYDHPPKFFPANVQELIIESPTMLADPKIKQQGTWFSDHRALLSSFILSRKFSFDDDESRSEEVSLDENLASAQEPSPLVTTSDLAKSISEEINDITSILDAFSKSFGKKD